MTRIGEIIHNSVVDGLGLRTAFFFSGCRIGCPGCHNPQLQDFNCGQEYTIDQIPQLIDEVIEYGDSGITLTGGHPVEPENKDFALALAREAHAQGLNVWLYTGNSIENIPHEYSELLKECDVVVDGPFMIKHRTFEAPFRGSSNQRLIDMKRTIQEGIIREVEL